MIIPGSWIFSLVVTFPGFLITNFDKEIDGCGESFPEEWMAKAYSLTWLLSTTALPLALMVGLYSTVAYALWFKRNEDSQLTHQQKVRVNEELLFKTKFMHIFLSYVTC